MILVRSKDKVRHFRRTTGTERKLPPLTHARCSLGKHLVNPLDIWEADVNLTIVLQPKASLLKTCRGFEHRLPDSKMQRKVTELT